MGASGRRGDDGLHCLVTYTVILAVFEANISLTVSNRTPDSLASPKPIYLHGIEKKAIEFIDQ